METTTQGNVGAKSSTNGRVKPREYDLDALAALDVDALGRLYEKGTVPSSLDVLEGHPRGRMLSVKTLDHGPLASFIRNFSAANGFPWGGKSFMGRGKTGEGINRVHLFGRHNLFPFHTHIGPSVLDGKPCVILDYDLGDNPALIRSIHDEIREVDTGLFLGPAMWKTKAGPTFVLWFALDTRVQAERIGT